MITKKIETVMSVDGSISPEEMGKTLSHEHILVDFIGANAYTRSRWDETVVIEKVLPYLKEARAEGWESFVDCTPNYLGRDPVLLQKLSRLSGLRKLTNTGFYGGSNEKYLPRLAFEGSEQDLADAWIKEFREGIDGTEVRPGFIKISVNPGALSELSKKLVCAAAITHLETGLTIMSHTGPAIPAMEQIEILKSMGVAADAFIWTHAQNETDKTLFRRAALQGAWVSLDGVSDENAESYGVILSYMKAEGCLNRVLLSHDAGWFEPGEKEGGSFRGFGALTQKLLPHLRTLGFTEAEMTTLIRTNPATAFVIQIRPVK